jgi:hypothetical protein
MFTIYNTQGVEPHDHFTITTGRDLAESIGAHAEPEVDDVAATRAIEEIIVAAFELLEEDETDGFHDYDADGDRRFYRLGNGEIGVH